MSANLSTVNSRQACVRLSPDLAFLFSWCSPSRSQAYLPFLFLHIQSVSSFCGHCPQNSQVSAPLAVLSEASLVLGRWALMCHLASWSHCLSSCPQWSEEPSGGGSLKCFVSSPLSGPGLGNHFTTGVSLTLRVDKMMYGALLFSFFIKKNLMICHAASETTIAHYSQCSCHSMSWSFFIVFFFKKQFKNITRHTQVSLLCSLMFGILCLETLSSSFWWIYQILVGVWSLFEKIS